METLKRMMLFIVTAVLIMVMVGCAFLDGVTDNYDYSSDEEEDYMYDEDDDEVPSITDPIFRDFRFTLPIFSPDSPWNQDIGGAAVLPESDKQILVTYRVLLGDISDLEGYNEPATNWPYMDINLYYFSIPIFLVGTETQSVFICEDDGIPGWPNPKFNIDEEGGPVNVPAPAGMVRTAGPEDSDADGHLVLYDPKTHIAYDYYRVTTQSGEGECLGFTGGMTGNRILEAGEIDFFDVRDLGFNPDDVSSARAHGTPLLAGLIIPEDIESGAISHALAFAIPGPRNLSRNPYEPRKSDYFYPASTTETDFYNTNRHALAAGQRIRLKQSLYDEEGTLIDESQFSPITSMFLTALRTYGAYLVDNAGGFSFYAEDIYTAGLNMSDAEVNALIGHPAEAPFTEDQTKWQIVMEALYSEIEIIPLAISPGDETPNPRSALIEISNFEVVEPAPVP